RSSCLSEWSVIRRSKLDAVAHDGGIFKLMVIQGLPDPHDPAIHHIGRRHHIGTRLCVSEGHFLQYFHRLVIMHIIVMHNTAMPMGSISTGTYIRYNIKIPPESRSELPYRLSHYRIFSIR